MHNLREVGDGYRLYRGLREIEFNTATCKLDSESLGSLLARAPRESKSGLSAWSRESNSGVRHSLSNRMSTKNKIDREEVGMRSSRKQLKTGNNPEVTTPYGL